MTSEKSMEQAEQPQQQVEIEVQAPAIAKRDDPQQSSAAKALQDGALGEVQPQPSNTTHGNGAKEGGSAEKRAKPAKTPKEYFKSADFNLANERRIEQTFYSNCARLRVQPKEAELALMAYCIDEPSRLTQLLSYLQLSEEQLIEAHNKGWSFEETAKRYGAKGADLCDRMATMRTERDIRITLGKVAVRKPIEPHDQKGAIKASAQERSDAKEAEAAVQEPVETSISKKNEITKKFECICAAWYVLPHEALLALKIYCNDVPQRIITMLPHLQADCKPLTLSDEMVMSARRNESLFEQLVNVGISEKELSERISAMTNGNGGTKPIKKSAPRVMRQKQPPKISSSPVAAAEIKSKADVPKNTPVAEEVKVAPAPKEAQEKVAAAAQAEKSTIKHDIEVMREEALKRAFELVRASLNVPKYGSAIIPPKELRKILSVLSKDEPALKTFVARIQSALASEEIDVFTAAAALSEISVATNSRKSAEYPSPSVKWERCTAELSVMLLGKLSKIGSRQLGRFYLNQATVVQPCISYYLCRQEDRKSLDDLIHAASEANAATTRQAVQPPKPVAAMLRQSSTTIPRPSTGGFQQPQVEEPKTDHTASKMREVAISIIDRETHVYKGGAVKFDSNRIRKMIDGFSQSDNGLSTLIDWVSSAIKSSELGEYKAVAFIKVVREATEDSTNHNGAPKPWLGSATTLSKELLKRLCRDCESDSVTSLELANMVYVNIAPYLQEGDAKKAHDSIIALWRRTTDSPELLEHTPPSSIIQVEQRIEPVDKRELPGKRSARMI